MYVYLCVLVDVKAVTCICFGVYVCFALQKSLYAADVTSEKERLLSELSTLKDKVHMHVHVHVYMYVRMCTCIRKSHARCMHICSVEHWHYDLYHVHPGGGVCNCTCTAMCMVKFLHSDVYGT